MLASHYAPGAAVRLDARDGAGRRGAAGVWAAARAVRPKRVARAQPFAGGDLREAAANLFSHLQALDRSGAATIAVEPIPETGLGEAINDRLRRAAAPRDLPRSSSSDQRDAIGQPACRFSMHA